MLTSLLGELRHRRVLRSGVAYAIAAAAMVEFTDIVTPVLDLPPGLMRVVIMVALIGFPVVIVLSWFFDLTPDGVVVGTSARQANQIYRGRSISLLLIGLLAIAVAYLSYRLYWETSNQPGFERGKSIAVLPFSSISSSQEQETAYFSEGMAEEILIGLSKVDDLRVAARTSSFAVKDLDVQSQGEALNVSVVLDGSVRRDGDRLRITTYLIDTSTGFQFWNRVYNEDIKNVFQVQEKIAHSIVKALQIQLKGEHLVFPGTENTLAYEKYLEGRALLQKRTPSAAERALAIFEQALMLDSNYAQAYAGLADAWIQLREVGNLTLLKATTEAHSAISSALKIDSELPEAQAALGQCILGGGAKAEAGFQFQKAINLDPEYADAYLLRANLLRDQGYLSEATTTYSQALSLDPFNPAIVENQALLMAFQGRFETARGLLMELLEKNPDNSSVRLTLSKVWALSGDNKKALDYAQQAVDLEPESPLALSALVESLLRMDQLDQAQRVLTKMLETSPNNEAVVTSSLLYYLSAGEHETLDSIATARVTPFIERPESVGPEFLFERVAWAATAKLATGQINEAFDLFEKGIAKDYIADPNPAAIHAMALRALARRLNEDYDGASEMAESARNLTESARKEGRAEAQLEYALAGITASIGAVDEALVHLHNAIEAGWNDHSSLAHDPLMQELVLESGFQALLD